MKAKVAVVGVGGMGAEHLKNLSRNEKVEIVALCDISKEAADKAVAAYGGSAYTSYDEMLEKETLDAIFLCVPPFAHGDMEEKAAAKGIHLLVEKPVGLDIETVRRKQKVLDKAGIIVGTGYCLRYMDLVTKAKEYLQGKTIAMIRAHRFDGFVQVPWWREMAKSGGQLVE
jgi:predicted dehydrogenase